MPKSLVFFLAGILIFGGAGCSKRNATDTGIDAVETVVGQKPTLRITNPQNGAKIDAATTTVTGETDVDAVLINGQVVQTTNGLFSFETKLVVGNNPIQFLASNENGSTTAAILIVRPAPAKGSVKTTAPPPTTKTDPAPKTNVTFVSSELRLAISLSVYGADLAWTKPAAPDIKGYAIVKSTTDPSPFYPKVPWTQFINDYDRTTWRDTSIEKGKLTYYRICTIGNDSSIRCGNVASVLKP